MKDTETRVVSFRVHKNLVKWLGYTGKVGR